MGKRKNTNSMIYTTAFIIISLFLISITTQGVLNGCDPKRCIECKKANLSSVISPENVTLEIKWNRYCTRCMNSTLEIHNPGIDQKCHGKQASIKNCLVVKQGQTASKNDTKNSKIQIICDICEFGYSLTKDKKQCLTSRQNCFNGAFNTEDVESCISCENHKQFEIVSRNGGFGFSCIEGGIELKNCWIKGNSLATDHPSWDEEPFYEVCRVCNRGYTVKPDGSCVKSTEELNPSCVHATPFDNQCTQCNWRHGYFAVGTAKLGNEVNNAASDNGNQFCLGVGILRLWRISLIWPLSLFWR